MNSGACNSHPWARMSITLTHSRFLLEILHGLIACVQSFECIIKSLSKESGVVNYLRPQRDGIKILRSPRRRYDLESTGGQESQESLRHQGSGQ